MFKHNHENSWKTWLKQNYSQGHDKWGGGMRSMIYKQDFEDEKENV